MRTARPRRSVVERALADIDFQLGNRDSAAKRFSNLVSSGRFVYESLFYLGAIAESREAWDDALQLYGRVTSGELAMAAQGRAARIKVKRQGLDAGLKHLEEFAATRPQYRIDALTSRATLLADSGDRSGALALLDGALKEYPDSVELRFARIFQLESADKVDESIADLRKLVADRPGDPAASNALGYTLVDRTRHHREGIKLIEAGARADARQRRRARQHGMGVASRRTPRGCTWRISSTPSDASTIRKSICISAKFCSRSIARRKRARC